MKLELKCVLVQFMGFLFEFNGATTNNVPNGAGSMVTIIENVKCVYIGNTENGVPWGKGTLILKKENTPNTKISGTWYREICVNAMYTDGKSVVEDTEFKFPDDINKTMDYFNKINTLNNKIQKFVSQNMSPQLYGKFYILLPKWKYYVPPNELLYASTSYGAFLQLVFLRENGEDILKYTECNGNIANNYAVQNTQTGLDKLKYFKKSSRRKNALGHYNRGVCHEFGIGVSRSSTKSQKWYGKAKLRGFTRPTHDPLLME